MRVEQTFMPALETCPAACFQPAGIRNSGNASTFTRYGNSRIAAIVNPS
jgi:hypothetical protein